MAPAMNYKSSFASKIRYLQEYHNRVLHNIYPVPSGTDIANTLKYFSQTLLSILSRTGKKENQDASNLTVPMTMCLFPVPFPLTPSLRPQVSSINPTVTRSLLYSVLRDAPSERGQQSRDAQLSDYPSLDYQGLYVTLVTLLDLVPLLQHGQHDLGQSIFYTTTCLLPFLNDDILSTLPYTMISTLATFPPFLHKDIIEYLSTSFLPMAILGSSRREGVPAHVNLSASSMLMIAMQYTSNPVYHCQLLECLMKYKQEVWKDLLYVIAYGPSQVKPPAVQMLFHYWPNLKPPGAISEYRGLQYTAWNPIHCQHIECHNAINKPAVKMCIEPSLSVALGDKPPPLYLCEECSQRIAGDHSEWLVDVLLPQAEISAICQKKNCSSHVRRAVVTCFSAGCCGRHGNRPVRYCKRCHSNHHSSEVGAAAETHLYQTSPPPINTRECGAEELVCTVEAVISLLKEAEFHAEQREYELNRRRQMGLSSSHHSLDNTDFDNKDDDKHDQRILSQFGIWFLVSLCTPSENTPTESLARLVSMVFQWFHSTAYMMDDEVGSLVEKLKPQFVTKWLKTVCDVRFDVMVMCLLPKPMEFARVGGYWDKSCSTVTQLKEGLNRILCLIPYNVINQPVWECIMPEWLEAIRTEVPDNQLKEFREVLSKMFDIELCPLPFSMEEMFGFISCRFTGYPSSVQEQALLWLHVLSELDIVVPLQLLISMFSDGVNSVKELANQRKSRVSELAGNLGTRRVSVASDPGRRVQHNMLSPFPSPFQSPFRSPMLSPFRSPFKNFGHPGGRTIDFDCDEDEMNLNCFILMFDLILKQMELQDDGITLGLENSLSKDIISIINNVFQAPWGGSHTCQKDEKVVECNLCQSSILCYQLACGLLERLAPKEEIRLVEPTDNLEDSLLYTRPEFIIGTEGEEENKSATKHGENPGNHTETTENATSIKNDTERKFCYQQLPVTLKLIYTILQEMARFEEPDILFNMLNCLKILCLHGECLYISRKDHPQFLAYIQDHMLIASLWRVVKSDFSQLSSLAVPLLLHALSLPHGADIFWTIINSNFNSKDWKMRFEAVEKVAVLCRFLDIHSVTKNHLLKYSLAHAFCCFLTAVEDVNPAVATRAGLLLDTIKRPALQGLCLCLDFQFDTVVKDRPTILSKLLLLHFLKQDIPALSWEFFVNRFETLSLEAQLHLDCNKEFPFPTTITAVRTNVANLSDTAMWKIKRARFARNRQKSVRSLRDSVKGPGESKRALSLPETLTTKIPVRLTRHEQSAPALGGTPEQTPGQPSPENDNTIKDLLPEDAGIDHQTVHQLITVLMKFMAKDESSAESDISSAKAFNTVKRHLYVLLGYDQQEGCFMIAPQKMRISTCFNAFIAGIAQVMDYNINLGKHLLPLVVQVLKYCTCPQLRHYFQQPPRCSLWSIKPHIRQMWLKALLVILYKYPYRDCDISKIVLHLIYITVNTLNAQYHSCKPHATAGPLYSDNSNISRYSEKEKEEDSVFDESDIHDTPTGPCSKESQTFFARLKRIGGSKMVKYQPVEMNAQRNPTAKGLSTLEMPRESSSAPTLEAGVPETSSHSSISTQFRQMKRGSLGALTMNQLMKRQLEHQSSAPHNISTWDTEQIQHGKRPCNVSVCLNPDLEGPPLRIRGATKSSLLSAPSIVSMFVPAPEEFADDQPTMMTDKCHDCGAILEEYDEETLGLAIVVLSTFIHLSPDLAAPLLLDIMQSVGRLASSTCFSNQAESMMIPGNAAGVAKQFLRCIFHQLAPNGIFPQLFQSNIKDGSFLRTLATSLMDFSELSSVAALSQLLEGLNNKKNLPAGGAMLRCLENIATFMEALPMDSPSNLWTTISNQFQTFFTKLPCVLPLKCSLDSSLRIMICLLKIPTTSATRSLLEPFSKLLSFVIQNDVFTLAYLVELCGLCYRAFTKERDKFYLSRSVILELLQALKLKSPLPDTNLLLLVQFVCADAGTKLAESTILHKQMIASMPGCGTAAMECMRQYVNDVLDFIADMHTLTKLKSHMKTCSQPLHEDTFGGHLKVGLAQIAAMEITRGNHRDNKAVIRYLPWLYHPPSAMQQGPKEFIECVSHIRLLSWLLLGSLTHNVVCPNFPSSCMPIPLDAGSHIADHLIVILIGFPEQSKTSVLHMCSLFHAFIFAQLWTVYCEQTAVAPTVQNQNEFSFTAILTALEFWSRVTPSILQLMAHNKVMVEMVCLHVISLMEALQECNSTIFVKLIPMWLPMIQSNLKHLSAGLQLRLQAIQNNVNHHSLRMLQGSGQMNNSSSVLRKWLQCTQFKMAQVEIQSSEAASQFYPL
ncbi:protein unc-79 homolog isoform X7 [Caretta caretta]|uniref:protein unc-79 homolog isoform X7 n=1 Tax=Caretta caretta TaxID=8467 RepID=UPI002094A4BA|nr:protein unc-79 homolog isoform X6 [Caretta caretta]